MVTTKNSFRRTVPVAISCLALGLLISSTSSFAGESAPEPQTTMMTRLQELSSRASDLALNALSMLGIRYKYGGTTPDSGLDCSGLVRYVFKETWGAELPRTSVEISRLGQKIETKDLQPGDLVFYNTLKRGFSHVGIYLGDNKFIHSPSGGGEVRIESMDVSYWKQRFNGARRIAEPEQQQ
ncbi:MAG TPA: C40 family peptidase [Paucimonas sp.]|nr:C40 family peptidase [Paucimonas sp.]